MSPLSKIAALKKRNKPSLSSEKISVAGVPISKADVELGDILLLHYVPEHNRIAEMLKLLKLAHQAVEGWKHWADYDKETRDKHFAALMPLIHFAITAFDNNRYFHAAIVGQDADNEKVVIEAGPKGIMQTPLKDYWGGPISVYRYHRDAVSLGDKLLPAEPVLKKANDLCNAGDIEYGYYHAGLLAIWCLFRAGEDMVMDRLHAALVLAFGTQATEMLYTLIAPETIKLFLVDIFHRALDRWRQQKHLVCSEMVAVCFNEADGLGTYKISREFCKNGSTTIKATQQTDQTAVSEDVENAILALANSFHGLEIDRPLRAVDVALALVSSDVLYTPSDLERSVSTFNIGQT
ncbi:hypothetical protein [Kordiimonas aestuarii]|uniref:hypothetical protein n=1 Tax=Kordiimonas aestuarii TaxID=1005925 RepID=UPI0021D19397|nr:hypothetical protein [Kordiimonas aestuarii]